jgi:hypothetical protein
MAVLVVRRVRQPVAAEPQGELLRGETVALELVLRMVPPVAAAAAVLGITSILAVTVETARLPAAEAVAVAVE